MGFQTEEIEQILNYPDTDDNRAVPKEVFDVIYSLGRDAQTKEEAHYAYKTLVGLCSRESGHVRGYAVLALSMLSVDWGKLMTDDYDTIAEIIRRESERADIWEREQLEAAKADFRQQLGWKFETRTERPRHMHLRYSLIGARIRRVRLKKTKDNGTEVRIRFHEGFFMPAFGSSIPVRGKIVIQNADPDASTVVLFDASKDGKLKGRRLTLRQFEAKYPECDMEITREYYSDGHSCFIGTVQGAADQEFRMEILHSGKMIYITV